MKKILSVTAILLIAIMATKTVNAQDAVAVNNKQIVLPNQQVSKESNDARPLSKFTKEFAGATGESWSKTRDGFVVRFALNGIQHTAFLSKGGNCSSLIKYYSESELPKDVRHVVKSTYYDYSITLVREVNVDNVKAYLVTIEDATTCKVIRVIDGSMDVWEEFTKSN